MAYPNSEMRPPSQKRRQHGVDERARHRLYHLQMLYAPVLQESPDGRMIALLKQLDQALRDEPRALNEGDPVKR